jgi:hypothetical protein
MGTIKVNNGNVLYCYGFDFFFKTKPTKKERNACVSIVKHITPVKIKKMKTQRDVSVIQENNCITIMLSRGIRIGNERDLSLFYDRINKYDEVLSMSSLNYTGWETYHQTNQINL